MSFILKGYTEKKIVNFTVAVDNFFSPKRDKSKQMLS